MQRVAQALDPLLHNVDLVFGAGGERQHHRVKTALKCTGKFVDAAVAVVGRGNHVKALNGLHFIVQLGDGQQLFRQDGDQRVLHVGGNAGQLFDAGNLAVAHGVHHRARHQGGVSRTVGNQAGVVPAVANGFFARARGALDQQFRIAGNGRGQMLGDPRFAGAGNAHEQQGAVGGKRGNGDFDEATVANIFGLDLKAIVKRAAQNVGGHRPRR